MVVLLQPWMSRIFSAHTSKRLNLNRFLACWCWGVRVTVRVLNGGRIFEVKVGTVFDK